MRVTPSKESAAVPPPARAATIYTDVTIIVVLPNLQQAAEAAAIAADPEAGAGTFIPGSALRLAGDTSNTTAAYWCQWHMRSGQRSAFASTMGGPMNVISPGANVPTNRDRWMFDASGPTGWTPAQVLAMLGLEPVEIPL